MHLQATRRCHRALPRLGFGALLIGLAVTAPAWAQSTQASEASAYSVALSMEATAGLLALVPAGSALVVQAIRPVGQVVELVLVSAATGASIVLEVAASVVQAAGVVVGASLVVTAVSAGYLISLASEVIAFVPDALTHALIHHAELHR